MSLKDLSIKSRLFVLLVVPMVMIALFSLIFLNDLLEVKKDLQNNEQDIAKAAKIASFIDFLQLSRATSIQKNPNPQALAKLQS